MTERETGRVKWFNDAKGYGFIERSQGGDAFVHFSSVRGTGFKSLTEGQKVDYVIADGVKGPQAQDVGCVLDDAPNGLREAEEGLATAVAEPSDGVPCEDESPAERDPDDEAAPPEACTEEESMSLAAGPEEEKDEPHVDGEEDAVILS